MRFDQFRAFQLNRPFEPFVIQLVDGQRFQIRHPDALALNEKNRSISILNAEGLILVINVLHILLLRPLTKSEKKALR